MNRVRLLQSGTSRVILMDGSSITSYFINRQLKFLKTSAGESGALNIVYENVRGYLLRV